MSSYRNAVFALVFLFISVLMTATASAQKGTTKRLPTLEERLVFGLKARRASERAFIKRIVLMVNMGELKQKTVDESFFWVRNEMEKKKRKDPNAKKHIDKYPFFYFEQVIKANAKRNGVIVK